MSGAPTRAAVAPSGPPRPPYGERTLPEVLPSVSAALGVPGARNPLGLAEARAVVLLMVDGLGWEGLRLHADAAPFLASLAAAAARPIETGFPATTATSLASLGTGLPPGAHGLVGYTFAVPGLDRPLNALRWEPAGGGPKEGLPDDLAPELLQPNRTAFERAAANGVHVFAAGPPDHAGSGLTRATLRGGEFVAAYSIGDLAATAADLAAGEGRRLVYAYHASVDLVMHLRGTASESAALELAHVDRLARDLADLLPSGAVLLVTGDHGLMDVGDEDKLDVADLPGLQDGVRMLGGEPRARFVYARPGAAADVAAAWRAALGGRMWVLTREEAIAAGLFGPSVPDRVRPRIGDVVAISRGRVAVFNRVSERRIIRMVAHHGALTDEERLVPLLVART